LSSEEYARILCEFCSGDAADCGMGIHFNAEILALEKLSGHERAQALEELIHKIRRSPLSSA